MDSVSVTIDGHALSVRKGATVLQAALEVGIDVPFYCYHPALGIDGSCRVCIVKIEKMPKLQTSCSTVCTEGMVVSTRTPDVVAARAGVFEFLLVNHPLDCPVCDEGGECQLQDLAFAFGKDFSRMDEAKRTFVSVITLISVIGVMLGVAVLIVVIPSAGFAIVVMASGNRMHFTNSIATAISTLTNAKRAALKAGKVVQAGTAPVWITPQKGGATTAVVDESVYTAAATTGTTYRWSADQYVYNWTTKGVEKGYFWRLGVQLDDGQAYYVTVGLR